MCHANNITKINNALTCAEFQMSNIINICVYQLVSMYVENSFTVHLIGLFVSGIFFVFLNIIFAI